MAIQDEVLNDEFCLDAGEAAVFTATSNPLWQ
jgi:hypothetical protein